MVEETDEVAKLREENARLAKELEEITEKALSLAKEEAERTIERNRLARNVEFLEGQITIFESNMQIAGDRTAGLQAEVDVLRKANLDKYGTTEATELIQVRARTEAAEARVSKAEEEVRLLKMYQDKILKYAGEDEFANQRGKDGE